MIKKLKAHKWLSMMSAVFIGLGLVFYFNAFFSKGVYFYDHFLPEVDSQSGTVYQNRNYKIEVTEAKNTASEVDVIYTFPYDEPQTYSLAFRDGTNWGRGIAYVEDDQGEIITEEDDDYFSNAPTFYVNSVPVDGYQLSPKHVVDMAKGDYYQIRGQVDLLIMAFIIFIITAVDITFPLFFFKLKYFLSVNDPEPSDFYLAIQRMSWIALPIMGLFIMLLAIT